MSSLKMTFSLASLVLILGLIAMPVMAQEDRAVNAFPLMVTLPALAAAAGDAEGVLCYCRQIMIAGIGSRPP